MKLLFDQNLSFRTCPLLDDIFPGSRGTRWLGLAQSGDKAIWDHAKLHGFVLVSHDADFAEMAALWGHPQRSSGCVAAINEPR
jgi:predicted nuclease of predicted toxin-antitoxin system